MRGFYQYFGLHHCQPKLDDVRREVQRQWIRVLRRRSQRHPLYWGYLLSRAWFELPYATTCHRLSDAGGKCDLGSPVREICTPGSERGDE